MIEKNIKGTDGTMHQKREIDMLHGKLAGKLLRFALPLAVTGILQQLFNAADVAVVGRFCGNAAMAAVGSNAAIVGLLVNLFVGVALGTNVVIAQYTGQGKLDKVSRTIHSSLLVALVCGLLLTVLGEVFAPMILQLMSVPEEVLPLSVLYLRIYMAGMPVILLYNFLSAIFRSQGDTRTPLICLTIAGVVNVALNLFFVVVLGRSVDGVATATVVSNTLSSVMLFVTLLRSDGAVKVEFSEAQQNRARGTFAGLREHTTEIQGFGAICGPKIMANKEMLDEKMKNRIKGFEAAIGNPEK
jgi:putative MATE family efflux protein